MWLALSRVVLLLLSSSSSPTRGLRIQDISLHWPAVPASQRHCPVLLCCTRLRVILVWCLSEKG